MNVLILTNREHIHFVAKEVEYFSYQHTFAFRYTGEYDWSEDYDIGISFMYQHKVPAEEVNSHTWINFHPGPLPEYKGRNLCYHAIVNGETEFGASIHYMNEDFDEGDIIDVWKFPVYNHDTAGDISHATIVKSKHLFEYYLPRILSGEKFERIPNTGGYYYPKKEISDVYVEGSNFYTFVRSVTCGRFVPKIDIGGVIYKIVKE